MLQPCSPQCQLTQSLDIIKGILEEDNTLKERTVLTVKNTILLLEFCLHNTYFSFQEQFYEQVEGATMFCSTESTTYLMV